MKTYAKGRRFEYQVKKMLEKDGYIVFRLAGSKPLDLIAFRKGKVMFCECKTSEIHVEDKQKLGEWSVRLGYPISLFVKNGDSVKVEVFERTPRKAWRNIYELLKDFTQFLFENYGRDFPNGDVWVNFSQLDDSEAIWKFLFEGEPK